MQKVYSYETNFRTSDYDFRGNIKPSSILDIFQEIAGAHATELNIGFNDLLEKNLLWVLVRVKFEIVNKPKKHQKIVAKTWPLIPGRVSMQREYLIQGENGQTLVKGTSEWVTMHIETRKLVQSGDIYPLESFCDDKMFEDRIRKVSDFEAKNDAVIVTPAFCDIDENEHVNNIKYADYVVNAYCPKENEEIEVFQLDFHREIKMGSSFSLFYEKENDTLLAKGISGEGEKMFSCAIKFKNT